MTFNTKPLLLLAAISSAYAQAVVITPTRYAEVSSSVSITSTTVGPVKYYSLGLSVSYPVGLSPASYISAAQLNTDLQAAFAAYPSPQDPQEAVLSTAVTSLLQKYPQMNGATLFATPNGTPIGGIAIPSSNSIIVEIVNVSPAANAPSLLLRQRRSLTK